MWAATFHGLKLRDYMLPSYGLKNEILDREGTRLDGNAPGSERFFAALRMTKWDSLYLVHRLPQIHEPRGAEFFVKC